VAVTRAKEHIQVVSSLSPGDIDLQRTNSRGVEDFKHYLEYAKHGERALARSDSEPQMLQFDSEFEEAVYTALEDRGFDVVTQVQSSGYSIDLAIRHPDQPGKYVLGIECDGAAYHSSKTARDRDRTRQTVLESLGWTIHRIWSPDWASNKERELDEISSKVDDLLDQRTTTDGGASTAEPEIEEIQVAAIPEAERGGIQSHLVDWEEISVRQKGDKSFDDVWESQIEGVLASVAKRHGPVAKEQAFRATINRWQISRLGKNIQQSLDTITNKMQTRGKVKVQDGFIWPGERPDSVSIRVNTNQASRSIDEIPHEELAKAAHLLLDAGTRMTREDLVLEVARLIGYHRRGQNITDRIDAAIDVLLEEECASTAIGADGSTEMIEFVEADIDRVLLNRVYA
jgi:very-short-patch-repair endonuclease